MKMRVVLSVVLAAIIFGSCFAGYYAGVKYSQNAFEEVYLDDSSMNLAYEAKHDFYMLKAHADHKLDLALNLAQERYYSRIVLAADFLEKRPNQKFSTALNTQIEEAKAFYKEQPFKFSSEEMQRKWDALLNKSAQEPN
jgi:hypothetical protein